MKAQDLLQYIQELRRLKNSRIELNKKRTRVLVVSSIMLIFWMAIGIYDFLIENYFGLALTITIITISIYLFVRTWLDGKMFYEFEKIEESIGQEIKKIIESN